MMRFFEKVAVGSQFFYKKIISRIRTTGYQHNKATKKKPAQCSCRPFLRLVRPLSNYNPFMKKLLYQCFIDDVKVQRV